jgi:hypothetical protein
MVAGTFLPIMSTRLFAVVLRTATGNVLTHLRFPREIATQGSQERNPVDNPVAGCIVTVASLGKDRRSPWIPIPVG